VDAHIARDAPARHDSPPTPDATPNDSTALDHASPDAGTGDAGQDTGSVDSGMPCTAFCGCSAPDAQFCEDFDESSTFQGWTAVMVGGGSAAISQAEFRSSPNSFGSFPGGGSSVATINRTFDAGSPTNLVLQLSAYVPSCISGSSVPIATIQLEPGNSLTASLDLSVSGSAATFGVEAASVSVARLGGISTGAWFDLSLELDGLGTTSTTALGRLDGAELGSVMVDDDVAPPYGVSLSLGNGSADGGACTVYFDNVTLGWTD
jgi:hypothetical protein